MRIFDIVGAALLLAVASVAAPPRKFFLADGDVPVEEDGQMLGSKFTLPLVENTNFKGFSGLEAMLFVYFKYNVELPPEIVEAIATNTQLSVKFKTAIQKRVGSWGAVRAYPPLYYDSQYVVPVYIGTPGQAIYLNLDTGSSDLWVFSSDTPDNQVNLHTQYRPENSSTSELLAGETWSILYGDGSNARGIVYRDRVQVGQTYFPTQAVESAEYVSPMFSSDSFSSGIIGLAMSGANTVRPTQQLTYMDNIKDELASPLFTANLQKGTSGNYNFGFVSQVEYNGQIQYTPIYRDSIYWRFYISGYQVGSDGYKLRSWKGIADTGTTLLLMPGDIVSDYYSSVADSRFDTGFGAILFPCSSTLPDFWFGIGNYRGYVPGHYVNYGQVNATHCYGGIQSSDGIGFSIIGDILLKAQFVVFDLGNKRIGFANKDLRPE